MLNLAGCILRPLFIGLHFTAILQLDVWDQRVEEDNHDKSIPGLMGRKEAAPVHIYPSIGWYHIMGKLTYQNLQTKQPVGVNGEQMAALEHAASCLCS